MLAMIRQHVDERVTHRPWRDQRTGVIAVAPDGTPSPERAVDGARDPDGQPAEAADESRGIVGLDDHVDVIGLNTELNDPEAFPTSPRERCPDCEKHARRSQAVDG